MLDEYTLHARLDGGLADVDGPVAVVIVAVVLRGYLGLAARGRYDGRYGLALLHTNNSIIVQEIITELPNYTLGNFNYIANTFIGFIKKGGYSGTQEGHVMDGYRRYFEGCRKAAQDHSSRLYMGAATG